MALYLKISADRYELPIAVADTAQELARMLGVTANTIYSQMSHAKAHGRWCAYVKIEEEEDETE